jgi:hypothetical protein
MSRELSSFLLCSVAARWLAPAQDAACDPEFEVASIKPAARPTPAMMLAGQLHYRDDKTASKSPTSRC